jgi:hypothetical protein
MLEKSQLISLQYNTLKQKPKYPKEGRKVQTYQELEKNQKVIQ